MHTGNLAYYTQLRATKRVYLPVTLRLILVGFEGDGNQGVNLQEDSLEGWFEHIEHTLHHTLVPVLSGGGGGDRGGGPDDNVADILGYVYIIHFLT